MLRPLIPLAVLTAFCACRGCGERSHPTSGDQTPTASASVVPQLPPSDDGALELEMLGKRIEIHKAEPAQEIGFLLERAAITGTLEDYQAAVAASQAFVEASPKDPEAWKLRVQVLTRVHRFADARALLAKVDASSREDLSRAIDAATLPVDQVLPLREAAVKAYANTTTLTLLAATLAQAGRYPEARALIPDAVAKLHNNTPELMTWLLFQFGRIYELEGQAAAARELYSAARARMPGALEATSHLALEMIATGDSAGAKSLVAEALAANPHPELLAIAAQLDPARVAEAKAAWERYVAALPEAFSDHAARFYLAAGADPKRALELAGANFKNRQTAEARALVVEAALAAGDAAGACAVVDPLIAGGATKAEQFVAWRALGSCGRGSDADGLAARLGITH